MKLTVIFRGCGQAGVETWVDYARTRTIPLTDEQLELLEPPKGMSFAELILDPDEEQEANQ